MASPRAVSIRIGVAARARIWLQTLEAVHVREHQVQHDGVEGFARVQRQARGAGGRARHAEARPVEIVADHLGEAGVVFDQEDAVGHGAILAAMPAPPVAPSRFDVRGYLAPLLGGQHLRHVGDRLGEALAGGSASAICSARNASIAARSSSAGSAAPWRARRAACAFSRIGTRSLTRGLGDGAQLLLLLGRGVELDGRVPDRPVGAVLESRPGVSGARMKPGPCQ